jgi:hypothetical protein
MDNHKIIYSKNNLSNDLKILNKKLYHFKPWKSNIILKMIYY